MRSQEGAGFDDGIEVLRKPEHSREEDHELSLQPGFLAVPGFARLRLDEARVDPVRHDRHLRGRNPFAAHVLGVAARVHGDLLDVAVDGLLDPLEHPDQRPVLQDAEVDRVLRHQVLHVQDVRDSLHAVQHRPDDPQRERRRVREAHVHVLHPQGGDEVGERIENLSQAAEQGGGVGPMDGEGWNPDDAHAGTFLDVGELKRPDSTSMAPLGRRGDDGDAVAPADERLGQFPHEQRRRADFRRKRRGEHEHVHGLTSTSRG